MTIIFCSKSHENPSTNIFCQVCGERLSPPAVNSLVSGTVLEGRYRIVQQIGQGGFGRTYLCEDLNRFNEPCVLKEFAPQVHGTNALDKAQKLFEREASVLYQLQHSQIPKFRELFQLTTGGGGLFLVQDYVAGHTYRYALHMRLQQHQTFQEDEVRQLLVSLLPVLEYTHSLGVIHRDIAPDNLIMRASDGMPVLIDFGGVKQIAVNAEIQVGGNTEALTCLGKVGYAPHEQMQRGTVAPHSDLYALAATSLVLLTGEEPTTLIDPHTMTWHWRKFIELQPDLGEVFDRLLQPKPSDRLQSATEVLRILQPQSIAQSSTIGTVVVSPPQKNTPVFSTQITTVDRHGFWQILRRTWIGLLGIGAAIGLGWGATSVLKQPSPSPTVSNAPLVPTDSPSPNSPEPTSDQKDPKPIEERSASPRVESSPRSRRSRPKRSSRESLSSPKPQSPAPDASKTPVVPEQSPPSPSPRNGSINPSPDGDDLFDGSSQKPSASPNKPESPVATPESQPSSTDLNGSSEAPSPTIKP
jgi:serine/threonine protein kinase, bacterial